MNWLPYHRFEIESSLRQADALATLAAHVEPEKLIRFGWPDSSNDKRFEGQINGQRFHMRRVIGYRNSFLPVIDGEVQAVGGVSRIVVTMRPFVFVMLFAAVWCMMSLTFATTGPVWWVGLLMLAFLYLMVMGGFWFEASKQEQTLREIFRAR